MGLHGGFPCSCLPHLASSRSARLALPCPALCRIFLPSAFSQVFPNCIREERGCMMALLVLACLPCPVALFLLLFPPLRATPIFSFALSHSLPFSPFPPSSFAYTELIWAVICALLASLCRLSLKFWMKCVSDRRAFKEKQAGERQERKKHGEGCGKSRKENMHR